MDSLLSRLERRLGRYAIENIALYLVGGAVLAQVLSMSNPSFESALVLSMDAVARGEVWRLVTFLFLPPAGSLLWMAFALYIFYLLATNLEAEWGAFKFNVFYLVGCIGTIVAAAVTGAPTGNYYLNLSLTFAFATLFPDFEFLLFFVLPVKSKWIGLLTAAYELYKFVEGSSSLRWAIAAPLINYALFFSGHWRAQWRASQRRARHTSEPPPRTSSGGGALGARTCAICGAKEADGADIRVCSCATCGGVPRTLCLDHARKH